LRRGAQAMTDRAKRPGWWKRIVTPVQRLEPQPNLDAAAITACLTPGFWFAVVLTGIGTGLAAAALMSLLRLVQHVAYAYHSGSFLTGAARVTPLRRVLVLAGAGILAGLGEAARKARWGEQGDMMKRLWRQKGNLSVPAVLARAVLSIVLVGMGASLGREEAPKEGGAAAAAQVARWGKLSADQRRLLVAFGAGAGMAAVYNVPLGGALFAVEILLGTMALPLIVPAIATAGIATAVSWPFLSTAPTYQIPVYPVSASLLLFAVVIGPLAGLAAVPYVRAIAWGAGHKPSGWRSIVMPPLAFAAVGVAAITYPQILGNGKDVVQLAGLGRVGVGTLVALLLLKPLATVLCAGSGAPGGLFTPTITYGAVFGGLLGAGWSGLWPGDPAGPEALLGAGAVLAASSGGPLSSLVLVLELTRTTDTLMVPLLLAVTGATLVARTLDSRSIYSARA
jgi:CIC family chloride channel protein